jgi:hypothetical protein
MIGGGSKIGPTGNSPPTVVTNDPGGKPAQATTPQGPATPSDRFEAQAGRAAPQTTQPAIAGSTEARGATHLLQLARANPAAARQLVASLMGQTASSLADIEAEMAGARQMLAQLAGERFAKAARDKLGDEMRKRREKVSGLKLRQQLATRKMALLQQIAGKLGDPRLDDEIDKILQQHRRLKTDWGKRHHLLMLGSAMYSAEEDTPEHLRYVVSTEVRSGVRSEEVGEAISELSPRRALSDMIARSIDGSAAPKPEKHAAARRGELGKSIQNFTFVSDMVDASLEGDPFSPDKVK